jgi:hypothetical protein
MLYAQAPANAINANQVDMILDKKKKMQLRWN